MPPPSRRIVTVLAADAAGYSRAMSLDEPRALAALAASRRLIDAAIGAEGGRIFSTGGDSVLAEFPTSLGAVRCGIGMQRKLAEAGQAGTEVLPYRIGIHAGHVYANENDLLGETVNIAARLESVANPGGICISGQVRQAIAGLAELAIESMGAQVLKGISAPVAVARIRLGEPDAPEQAAARFSVAVLPFRAAAADAHWGEGLADDLIAALSRFNSLAVLARVSSFPLGDTEDPRQVAAALDVRFVVVGRVRVDGTRFHLAVQLVEGSTGRVLWADRARIRSDDLFTAQEHLVEGIVGALVGRLEAAGVDAAVRKRAGALGAFDLYLQGLFHAARLDPGSTHAAIDRFERALAIDPGAAPAMAMLALMRLRAWALSPGSTALAEVDALAQRALAVDPADSWCHLVAGQVDMYMRRLETAEIRHKKAHALNPYDAGILALWSPLATYLGKPEEGRALIERAMRLNPHHPAWYATNLGLACYCAGQYADGAAAYAGVAAPQTGVLAGLVACRARLDDEEGTAAARAALLDVQPAFSTAVYMAARPFRFGTDADHLREGLRLGGLPD